MLGILFALISLCFSALNDFLFKLCAGRSGSKGLMISLIGVIWFLALLLTPLPRGISWGPTLYWGTISGLFSAGANILLIEGMSRQSVGICSLIYRLNMVPVVIGAALFLNESPGVWQYLGILCAVAAVVCFQYGNGFSGGATWLGLLPVLIASLMRAAMGLSYRYGFLHGADHNWVAVINSFFWISGGIVYWLVKERARRGMDRKFALITALSGLLVAGIVFFMAWSVALGEASVVLPIAQMSFLVTFVLGVCFLKEKFRPAHAAALLFGTAAVVLLSL